MSPMPEQPVFAGEASILIHATMPAVFAYVADFTRHPEWVKNLSRVEAMSATPLGVGARFKAKEFTPPVAFHRLLAATLHYAISMLGGTRAYSLAELTTFDPPRRIAWSAWLPRRHGIFNRSEWEVLLEPEGEATRLTQRFRYLPQTRRAQRMLEALGGTVGIRDACLVNLRRLQQVFDAADDGAPSPVQSHGSTFSRPAEVKQ